MIKKIFLNKSFIFFGVLLTLITMFAIFAPVFISSKSIENLLVSSPQMCLVTIGMGILLIAGEIDLSVGSIFVVSTTTMATLYTSYNLNIFLGAIITIAIGTSLGIINGLLTTKTGLSSFIVTLGTMWAYRGIMLVLVGGYSIPFYPRGNDQIFFNIFAGKILGIPSQFLLLISFFIILWILLERTKFGNWIFATGSNKEAAYRAGVNVDMVKIVCFGILGMLSAIAALIQVSRVNASVPQTGDLLMLMAIAGAVVGGVSLKGGSGSILICLLGTFIIQVISLGLITLGVIEYYTNVAICILLITAAYVYLRLEKRAH